MLYFEFIKLQVSIYEFTGDMIGVIVEIWLWFVACTVAGYVWAVIPIRLPKAVPNVSCGVALVAGYVHVAPDG
jgi:hypothetical protein